MKKKKTTIIKDITANDDRISKLPEYIVHHILSFLDSSVHLVRVRSLSKNWFALMSSFPILDFNINKFTMALQESGVRSYKDSEYVRENFFKYVEYTTSRFCEQNILARKFKLETMVRKPTEVKVIDRCIGLIFKQGVQKFEISIDCLLLTKQKLHSANTMSMYCLPNILLSATSLNSLRIRGCKLPPSLMVDGVKFKSLKLLHLVRVPVDEEVIKYLTASCPLLEEFDVRDCYGLKSFCVYGHQNLKKVRIYYNNEVERINIEAPNLYYLHLMDWEGNKRPSLNLASCKKLATLSYYEFPSPESKGFADFLSNFPFLKNLFMKLPKKCNNLTLSSPSLKTFVLHSHCDLEEIDMNTPNLQLFKYKCHSNMPEPLIRDSAQSKTCMECDPVDDVDTLWFQKLRRFLDKKNGFKELKLHISANFINVEELKMIQAAPYELEHVELELDTIPKLSVYVAVVDAVLWCCRPQSITLKSDFSSIKLKERSRVVKFTYEKLLQQEDEGRTNIQIALSSSSKAKKHFRNLNSLLRALRHVQLEPVISFTKE